MAHRNGFRHYLTNSNLSLANVFVKEHNTLSEDRGPPVWSSTKGTLFPPIPVPPRIGIQSAVSNSAGCVTVAWDVALDEHSVQYILYYLDTPFSFAPGGSDGGVLCRSLSLSLMGQGYGRGVPSAFPYEDTVCGLLGNRTYYFVIRARDSLGNEDINNKFLVVHL